MSGRTRDERIAEYIDSPRLDQRLKRGATLSARVHGTRGLYRVSVDLDDRGPARCTCPSEYAPCKHAEALLATYRVKPRSFVDMDQKVRKLHGMSGPELVRLFEKIFEEYPAAIGSLGVRGFSRASRWTDQEFHEEEAPDE